jgi:hypothetical protein
MITGRITGAKSQSQEISCSSLRVRIQPGFELQGEMKKYNVPPNAGDRVILF